MSLEQMLSTAQYEATSEAQWIKQRLTLTKYIGKNKHNISTKQLHMKRICINSTASKLIHIVQHFEQMRVKLS